MGFVVRACLGEPTPAYGHPSREGIIKLPSLCRVGPVLSLSKEGGVGSGCPFPSFSWERGHLGRLSFPLRAGSPHSQGGVD